MSEQRITDFNDLAAAYGHDAVKSSIAKQLEQPDAQRQPSQGDKSRDKPAASIWQHQLIRTDKGAIVNNAFNIRLILDNDPAWQGVLAYCDFSYRLLKRRAPDIPEFSEGEWEDADTARLDIWLTHRYGFKPGQREMSSALMAAAQGRRFHPVREYLQGLKWDGQSRLDKWLFQLYGAQSIGNDGDKGREYIRLVGRFFLILAVARVMTGRDGKTNKVDTMLILQGDQGIKKSTSISTLFGDWFSDSPVPIGDKDAYQVIQGVWGQEMAELDSFNKAESTAAKMFISQQVDRYRPSYGHNAQSFPRQTLFIGTTNQDVFLKDYTGNRRYWPVLVKRVDIEGLLAFRDQLWAEAFHAYQQGERWWVEGPGELELFINEQESRMQEDPWESKLQDFLSERTDKYFTSAELLEDCLGKPLGTQQKADQNRLGPIMQSLGWRHSRKRVPNKKTAKSVNRRVYLRPETDEDKF
jgi:putative DNA primase/helicase